METRYFILVCIGGWTERSKNVFFSLLGITGKGVTVVILDDGLDYKSKDLKDNFVSEK